MQAKASERTTMNQHGSQTHETSAWPMSSSTERNPIITTSTRHELVQPGTDSHNERFVLMTSWNTSVSISAQPMVMSLPMRSVPTVPVTSSEASLPSLVSNRELLGHPLLDQRTVRVGRWPHGNLDTSDDGLALAISNCFFAMTTGAMDVTVNALSLWGPRPWPTLNPSTPQRPFNTATRSSGNEHRGGVVETSQPLAIRPKPGPPHGIAERPERHKPAPVCKTEANPQTDGIAGASQQCSCPKPTRRMVSSKRPNRGRPALQVQLLHTPNARYRRSIPSNTDLHP